MRIMRHGQQEHISGVEVIGSLRVGATGMYSSEAGAGGQARAEHHREQQTDHRINTTFK
jgi:hypothetical protein